MIFGLVKLLAGTLAALCGMALALSAAVMAFPHLNAVVLYLVALTAFVGTTYLWCRCLGRH